ncbi:unnamed protein product [Adineta steineri]|uniref:Uncharacterized protein n=1 Tax=Adineta steineri TaxID=433720 RepID=A0A814CZL0_9BILA|nr:unnamed protein product [Adineta steineri]
MHIQKRIVVSDTIDDSVQKSSSVIEQKTHKCWRRFMNERAVERAYVPTSHEHAANCLTHGCLIIPSWIAAQRLLLHAKTPAQYWSSIIYGNALIFLFSFSTIFHCSCFHPTYKLLLRPTQTISTSFTVALVWIMSALGITYQTIYHERYKLLETCFYVIVGVFTAIVIIDMTDHTGILELAIGGLVFILGIFFFKCDGIIPFAHAIWHCFVFFGTVIEYYAIYTYLLVPATSSNEFYFEK